MADSLKRITKAKNKQFQDRVNYYLWEKAREVLAAEKITPGSQNVEELAYSKRIFANQAPVISAAMAIITQTTIGSAIDSDAVVSDTDIESAVKIDQFRAIAVADTLTTV